MVERKDDFQTRRRHLAELSDEELHARFWQLSEEVVKPLIKLAETHTSPSIERSVLLRMGLSSLEAKELVKKIMDKGLLGKGAGHIVWRLAREKKIPVQQATQALIKDEHWETVAAFFGGGNQ